MKFRLLERNFWGDADVWKGKKFNYIAEIETPFREGHKDFGKYSFRIKTPDGEVYNTYKSGVYFDKVQEAFEYVENWIIEDNKAKAQ